MNRRIIIGVSILGFIAVVDFILVNDMLLESNASMMAALLAAALFCIGLEGSPTLLGAGLVQHFDKSRTKTGTGALKSIVFIILGTITTIISFTVYIIIRHQTIVDRGGFSARYEGWQGDWLLMAIPIITSILALGIAIWMSSHGSDDLIKMLKVKQKALDDAMLALSSKLGKIKERLSNIWRSHFPFTDMPEKEEDAIEQLRGVIHGQNKENYVRMAPQVFTEQNIILPFIIAFKDVAKNYAADVDYLTSVEHTQFDDKSEIGKAYFDLQLKLSDAIRDITNRFSSATNKEAS